MPLTRIICTIACNICHSNPWNIYLIIFLPQLEYLLVHVLISPQLTCDPSQSPLHMPIHLSFLSTTNEIKAFSSAFNQKSSPCDECHKKLQALISRKTTSKAPFKRQSHKLVKYIQKIRRQFADELFECLTILWGWRLKGFNVLLQKLFKTFSLTDFRPTN